MSTEEFIAKCRQVHKNRYDYSLVEYVNGKTLVKIICRVHGVFEQTPSNHLHHLKNCKKCATIFIKRKKVRNKINQKFEGLSQPISYKVIPLSKGFVCKVSNEDFEYLKNIPWCFCNNYAYNSKLGYMHRLIMNPPENMVVDHIKQSDTLDNRRTNLRVCSYSQNNYNTRGFSKSSSEYKGVCRLKNYWKAQIGFNGKNINIGVFKSEIEAAKAYDKKARELFGEFAHLNFKTKTNDK